MTLCAPILALALVQAAAGQTPCPGELRLSVQVIDRRGDPIPGLTAADFRIQGRRVGPEVIEAHSNLPLDIVLLLQERSTGGLLSSAARLFVTELLPEDRVTVISFTQRRHTRVTWSSDPNEIFEAITGIEGAFRFLAVRNMDALLDGVKLFPEKEQADSTRGRVILMWGEEWDESARFRAEQVLPALVLRGVPLYLTPLEAQRAPVRVSLPAPARRDTPRVAEPMAAQSLARIAHASGGEVFGPPESDSLAQMVQRARARYLLTACRENKRADRIPAVELSPAARERFPAAKVLYPKDKIEAGVILH
ncbi:MAG: hypothetical protein ACK5AZ_23310 [Bryobacteraceae bacterium]